jgi:pimeloyl-ACP methyl ester carboxylesterase
MKVRKPSLLVLIILGVIIAFAVPQAAAQNNPVYVPLGGNATGALYTPSSGVYSHVGIIAGHPTANSLGCGTAWATRGFMALCMNTRYFNNEAAIRWETIILDVRAAVSFLKSQPGITKIVLVGASGGGALMSFYQDVAENGPSVCQGPIKLVECGNNLAGLPPADGLILNDSVPGYGVNAIRSINGAVTNDHAILNNNRPPHINPNLDPFDPKNGYNPKGSSNYSADFQKRYFKAQADRMNVLIDEALARLRQIEASDNSTDDAPFIVPRGDNARLSELDLTIHHGTVSPRKLLKNDGTIQDCCIVESVRVPQPEDAANNASYSNGTLDLTVRSFLSLRSIRAWNSIDGLDIDSVNNVTADHLRRITVPLLIVTSGGHYFIRDNENHYEFAASADKDFVVIEGAAHTGPPCVPCEQFPGQYANSALNQMNYMVNWLNQPGRF